MSDTPGKQVQTMNEVIDQVTSEAWKDKVSADAAQIVTALEAAGYVIVPKEPTEEMFENCYDDEGVDGVMHQALFVAGASGDFDPYYAAIFKRMIEARPR